MIGALCRGNDRQRAKKCAHQILELVNLKEEAKTYPPELPIATQKRIELARALAIEPELLMLDEIAAGLNPLETTQIIDTLRRIHREKNLTLLLTEHVMEFIMRISQRIIVMAAGRKIAEGTPDEVARNKEVIKAYLGEKYAKSK